MSENKTSSGGIGFSGLLTILFIGLKLTGVISWSWWWVLSPMWISFLIAMPFIIMWLWVLYVVNKDNRMMK